MNPHSQLIVDFYSAFQRRDSKAMNACYHPDVEFSDSVFIGLRHGSTTAMWTMLCERGKDLQVTYRDVQADDRTGRAHWDALYTFATTGRKVLNRIDAEFEFRDGKIVRHQDRFDFWTWSRQALGPTGLVLGWTPFLRNKVRTQARRTLDKYMRDHNLTGP
ncbi:MULTISPECIES: nuclear transport factor 2 family protein [Myxococcus]|uniref:Nuclear transport factor 2 family protein n=1 Tax=Myxococcus llanfairpwllgwyngyllgogerychwyrndrobwllllantysiliogogogochensis TaxID=2590453 RepID=A0A540WNI3_9BACT|nr:MULTISPECIES: nuclear transport factor 2 family protein [Myxococcus]NTX08911.1 nuclear transport factor 2 family protein [Myxococcus sp. CA040A]NTX40829.1 nuclear transport factor 2 family protein [Myxococcus sp. CA033]NTX58254.1 nuclear transport factor 2 family protein [Myxococcus sp. CA039A]TQF10560.1 nuclear transport factor 2 family protein [Myxococcus llanfairpwllgwyngyllgogerychwyrndrobwllllantysiliogogogochensis]